MREELGLVRGEIDVDRTVTLAPLAGETQVERVFDSVVAPSFRHRTIAPEHLPEQVRAAAGRMLLLERDHVARAHHVVVILPLAVLAPAATDADAPEGRTREAPVVFGEAEVGLRLRGPIRRTETEMIDDRIRLDDLARVHPVERVEDRLQLAHRLHQLRAEHLHEELGTCLSVAVLARERSAVRDDEVRRVAHEATELLDAARRVQIEGHPTVDQPHAEVPVQGGVIVVRVVEPTQVPEVGTEAFGGHRRVLPARPCVRTSRNERRCTETALAGLPERVLLSGLGVDAEVDDARAGTAHQRFGSCTRLALRRRTQLDHEPRVAVREAFDALRMLGIHLRELAAKDVVHALEGERPELEERVRRLRRLEDVTIAEHDHDMPRRIREELQRRLEHRDERGLAADEHSPQIEAAVRPREELIEVVPGDSPRDLRVPAANPLRPAIAESTEPREQCPFGAPAPDRAREILFSHPPRMEACAVVEDDVERLDVLDRDAVHLRAHATAVVPEHATETAMTVGRGLWSPRQTERLAGLDELVAHDAWLDRRQPRLGIQPDDPIHALGEVEHHGLVDRLARQRRPTPTRDDRRAQLATHRNCGEHVVLRCGDDDPERDAPVVRCVLRVERAGSCLEAYLALNYRSQPPGERFDVERSCA